ncbi:long-chain-fatty-acid--CoA ligase [Ruegeria sp. Ofav3-42]|uniref:long-chain-fatty-acid--CoA ligase n=1 Tax=Ruegeria sp. Ofav3-42 TaxID=2917759 RepID=UPI001EF6E7C3|nr:long-chain-fatty-acid--CoA ligase [Ruegeria sp. Ofav3-42]MCG7519905.1 long-chain-fatty-acid--CoA ligase [Ruegeria sp. Ofav3-42]
MSTDKATIPGQIMTMPLTVTSIFRHGMRAHPEAQIVWRNSDMTIDRYSFADMGRRTQQLAHALTELGVGPGDRVATLAWNNNRHLELYYALACIGAICHTINPRLHPDQIAFIINDAEDTHMFFDTTFAPLIDAVSERCPTVQGWYSLTGPEQVPQMKTSVSDYESLIAGKPDVYDWPELDENAAMALCYTSGTTGNPKGVLYSHRGTVLHAMGVSGGEWLALTAREAVLPVVPMFHACAWGLPYASIMNGTKLVLPGPGMDPAPLQELMDGEEVTMISGVPTVWLGLYEYLDQRGERLKTVKRAMMGGSAAPLSLIEKIEKGHETEVVHGWGMTELSPVGSLAMLKWGEDKLPIDEQLQIKTKQGRALYGVEMRIVNDEGELLPHDGIASGMLQVRGHWVASSYWGGAGADAFTEDGWFSTGDVAAIDPQGYLRLTDRTKDVIKSGGEWISSIDLESIAMSHPDVLEAACIAAKHRKWDERPLIVAVKREGSEISREDILALYDGQIAKWWTPDDVVFQAELPHTATGKVSKLHLRDQYADYKLPTDN